MNDRGSGEGGDEDTIAESSLPGSEHRTLARGEADGRTETAAGAAGLPGGLAPGATFAAHRVIGEIGRGGMGIVYRALHVALDRERALKVINPRLSADPRFRLRFQRESRLAASIEHPNVVPVHTAGEEDDLLYISMRVIEGPDLGQLVVAAGQLDPQRAALLVEQIGAGLDAAHAVGLVHRDVKPSNVMVELGRDGEHAYITDFGISRLISGDSQMTGSGEFLGSVDYVSPEQIEGRPVDERADVYSLAAVAHQMLTGRPPFADHEGPARLVAHSQAPRPRLSRVVPGLGASADRALARGMAVDPGDRPGSAGEFATEMASALRRRRRPRKSVIAAAVLVAGVAAGAAWFLGNRSAEETPAGIVAATIEIGGRPAGITAGPERMWAAAVGGSTIDGINPGNEVDFPDRPIGGGEPISLAVGFDSVWVVDRQGSAVLRLDMESGTIRIPVGARPGDVAVGDRWVWVTNETSDTVSRVDPQTNTVTATVEVCGEPHALAYGAGRIWVVCSRDNAMVAITADDAADVGPPIAVGRQPVDVAYGEGKIWVADNFEANVRIFDAASSQPLGEPISVGPTPRGIAAGLGYVWVANGGDDTVTRIDPISNEVSGAPIPVGSGPSDIAIGFGSAWTTDYDDGTVTRINPAP